MPAKNVDEYIAGFPKEIQDRLKKIRKAIKESAPKAEEIISWGMPAYKQNSKYICFFAAFKNHIGFFPLPTAIQEFKKELANYETTKGTIHLDNDKPIPITLVKKIVKFNVKINSEKKK